MNTKIADKKNTLRFGGVCGLTCGLLALAQASSATVQGLNQIPTPDVQKPGALSISYQQADPELGNRYQAQFDLGVTPRLELAAYRFFSPPNNVFGAEYGIIQRRDILLSVGFTHYTTKGYPPNPFLEAGSHTGRTYVVAGVGYETSKDPTLLGAQAGFRRLRQTQAIFGASYHFSKRFQLAADYQAGPTNYATGGFFYNITPQVQINPSLFFSNAAPHKGAGQISLSWTIQAFK